MENKIMYLFEHEDFENFLILTSQNLSMPFDFVEKDYWVTYTLFKMKESKIDDFVFKGGTSLTKGWGLLDRFSEDIDLLFYPNDKTKSAKESRLKNVSNIISCFKGLSINKDLSENQGQYRANFYDYVKKQNDTASPLLNRLKLEMGFRGNANSKNDIYIQSYVATELEKAGQLNLALDVPKFKVPILDIKRTFTEKLFAIHTAFENKEITKYYRHYYDVFKLIQQKDIKNFYDTKEFVADVEDIAKLSTDNFPKTKLPPNNDFKQSQAFKHTAELAKELQRAIDAQRTLFFRTPPAAEDILNQLESFILK